MLVIDEVDVDKVLNIYKLFRNAMREQGQFVAFPKNVDPRKTYAWRYLVAFVRKLEEEQINEDLIPCIIKAIVENAKMKRILSRGLSILSQNDLLKIGLAKLERETQDEARKIKNIIKTHEFLISQLNGNGEIKNRVDLLSYRPNKRSYANVTRWFQAGQLNLDYIALSKSCQRAIRKLELFELQLFPKFKDHLIIRWAYLTNDAIHQQIKTILGHDLIEE